MATSEFSVRGRLVVDVKHRISRELRDDWT